MVSQYSNNYHTKDPRYRRLSWHEFAVDRKYMCDHLTYEVLEPAKELLEGARARIRGVLDNQQLGSGREAALAGALTASYNAMTDTEKVLRDDDSESDSEHASVSERATE